MGRSRRRFQWIDVVQTTLQAVAGAVAPGTVADDSTILESEIENVGGALTLIRTVGDILVRRTAGTPIATCTLYVAQAFTGAGRIADWDNDAFQRMQVLGTWLTLGDSIQNLYPIRVDLRTKRKLGQGELVILSIQNHSTAGNDFSYVYHLRHLVMLP